MLRHFFSFSKNSAPFSLPFNYYFSYYYFPTHLSFSSFPCHFLLFFLFFSSFTYYSWLLLSFSQLLVIFDLVNNLMIMKIFCIRWREQRFCFFQQNIIWIQIWFWQQNKNLFFLWIKWDFQLKKIGNQNSIGLMLPTTNFLKKKLFFWRSWKNASGHRTGYDAT